MLNSSGGQFRMKLSGLLLLFGLVVSASAQDKAQPKPTYESMVERAKAGDETVDFRSLRFASPMPILPTTPTAQM